MDTTKASITDLLTMKGRQYLIPVYQRNYSWGKDQCEQLFADICSTIESGREHFFGSIVIKRDKIEDYLVIDGQQRLTTVSLMCIAMHKLFIDKKKDATTTLDEDYIKDTFCFKSSGDEILKPRIEHVEKDKNAYWKLIIGDEGKFENSSNLTINFRFFYNSIEASSYSLKQFYDALTKLMIARIDLGSDDNAQEIFESLNSTGLILSDGDKIRNYLLMDFDDSHQRKYYKDYWIEIEKYSNFSGQKNNEANAVSLFVRDYMTPDSPRIPKINQVYKEFKYFKLKKEESGINTLAILKDMLKYSHYLYEIENGTSKSHNLNRILQRLSLMGMKVLHPFELKLMDDFHEKRISENEICDIFEVVENYVFRRFMVNLPSNTLNKTFKSLYKSAFDLSKSKGISLYDAVVYILTSKTGKERFPDDKEFKASLESKDAYEHNKNKDYIFLCLNGGKNPEGDTSIIKKLHEGKQLSIEHIMPRTLPPSWISELGGTDNANRIHHQWINNIANLTITAFNGEYSNLSFTEKLNKKNEKGELIGYSGSPLPINNFVKKQTRWGEEQLIERLHIIQKEAIETIWRYPEVKYQPNEIKEKDLTLKDDAEDFTDMGFLYGTLGNKELPLKSKDSWKNVFREIIKQLDFKYHNNLEAIASKGMANRLQNESTKDSLSSIIVNGIYAKLNKSASELIGNLQNIFNDLNLDLLLVTFHVYRKKKK